MAETPQGLPASQREQLLAVLRTELRKAHAAALADGVPATALTEAITERIAALAASNPDAPTAEQEQAPTPLGLVAE